MSIDDGAVKACPFRSTRYLLVGLSTAAISVVLAALFAYTGGQIVDVSSLSRKAAIVLALLLMTAVVGWVAIATHAQPRGTWGLYVAECVSGAWLVAGILFALRVPPSPAGVVAYGVVALPAIGAVCTFLMWCAHRVPHRSQEMSE